MKNYDLKGHPYNRLLFVMVLLLGSFTMSISQSSISTAYPTLMQSFQIDASTVQWLTTGFMLIMCVMMPVSPWLLNNVKFKQLFIIILVIFDIGTFIVVIAPNFTVMMIGRALEAVAVGILFPSYQSVLLYITPEEKRGTTMGFVGLVMGSALASGPILSAIVLHFAAWRGLFIVFMVIITVLLLISMFAIRDVMPQTERHLDIISVLLSCGLIGILYAVNLLGKGHVNIESTSIILGISLLMVAGFAIRQFKLSEPLLQLRVLKNFNYNLSVGLTGASYVALIVVTIIFPLYYQDVLGVSKTVSGLALAPGAICLSLLNPLTGKLADKIGFKSTMLVGMGMILAGWLTLTVTGAHLGLIPMMIIAAVIEGGNAFVMMPAVTMGANSLPKNLISDGTAVLTTFRQILGSTGVLVATLILSNVTSDNLVRGMSHLVAQIGGYHAVFLTFFIIELVGLGMALMLKNTRKN